MSVLSYLGAASLDVLGSHLCLVFLLVVSSVLLLGCSVFGEELGLSFCGAGSVLSLSGVALGMLVAGAGLVLFAVDVKSIW